MGKYATGIVALLLAAFMYRAADVYFTERRLRHDVWVAMDPSVVDDEAVKKLVMERILALGVEVDAAQLEITTSEQPSDGEKIGGVVQVFNKTRSATFPFVYRKWGVAKSGVMTIKRQSAVKGAVTTP